MATVPDLERMDLTVHTFARFPVKWSDERRAWLGRVAQGSREKCYSSIDDKVAPILLLCCNGEFEAAEREALQLLRQAEPAIWAEWEAFYQFTFMFFVIQRTDIVAALLCWKYGFSGKLRLRFVSQSYGDGCVLWSIMPDDGTNIATFSAEIFNTDRTSHPLQLFRWCFPLIENYARAGGREHGSVFLNMADVGVRPGIAFSDSRPDRFLLPDYVFVPTRGYGYARQILREKFVDWKDRIPTAFWRGGTTGSPNFGNDWRTLDRYRLVEIATHSPDKALFDVGFSNIVQVQDPAFAETVKARNMLLGPIPWQDWGRYRYLIDIDGNSSPWSNLFQKLLTGSPVLKIESRRGYRQWFYDELKPWENYVPIASDAWDLIEKVKWLRRNDDKAQEIGRRGLELAESLTYENEMRKSVPVIDRAFRYFRTVAPDQIIAPPTADFTLAETPDAAISEKKKDRLEIDVCGLGRLSAILCMTPALRELKRKNPAAQINFYGNYLEVLEGLPFVDRTADFSLRPSGAIELAHGPGTNGMHVAQAIGRTVEVEIQDVIPACHVDPSAVERMRALIAHLPRPWILVHRNSSGWTPNKDWPSEMWVVLLQRLRAIGSVIEIGETKPTHGPGYELGSEFVSFNAKNRTSLHEFIALISLGDVLVAPETASVHIAAAVRTPAAVILGGFEPESAVRYPGHEVLANVPECSPCWREAACPVDKRCLRAISVDDVESAVGRLLVRATTDAPEMGA